jgi:hypothetical protein
MQPIVISVTATGTTGSASGATTASVSYSGKLHAVYFDTIATTASTFLRITQNYAPSATLLSANSTADSWYFPRNAIVTSAAAAVTGTSAPYPVTGHLAFGVGTSVPGTHIAYIYIEEQ